MIRPGDIVATPYHATFKLTRNPGWDARVPFVGRVGHRDVCLVVSTAVSQFGVELLLLCNHGGTVQLGWQVANRFEAC